MLLFTYQSSCAKSVEKRRDNSKWLITLKWNHWILTTNEHQDRPWQQDRRHRNWTHHMFCSYLSLTFPWERLQIVHSSGTSALRLKIRSHLRHPDCFKKTFLPISKKKIPKILNQWYENIPLIRSVLGTRGVIIGGREGKVKSSPLGIFHISQNWNTKQVTLRVVVWPGNSQEFSHYRLELQVPLLDAFCKS